MFRENGVWYFGTGSLGIGLIFRATDPIGMMFLLDAAVVQWLSLLLRSLPRFCLALRASKRSVLEAIWLGNILLLLDATVLLSL